VTLGAQNFPVVNREATVPADGVLPRVEPEGLAVRRHHQEVRQRAKSLRRHGNHDRYGRTT